MKQSYFMKIYKKRWFYRLITLGLLLIIIGIPLSRSVAKFYKNTNNPTFLETNEDYLKAIQHDYRPYVKISADELINLGLELIETKTENGKEKEKSTKGIIVAINLDEKLLAVSIPTKIFDKIIRQEKDSYLLMGKLTEFKEKDLAVFKDTFVQCGISPDDLSLLLYDTYYLDYMSPFEYSLTDFILEAIFIIITLIIFIPMIYKNIKSYKSLKKYSHGDIEIACQQIDNEIKMPDVYKNGCFTITRNYMIVDSQKIVFALPLNELMWVYKRISQRKINGIPIFPKVHSLVFVFSDKNTYKVNLYKNRRKLDETLQYINQNCATPIVGFSEDLEDLYNKNPNEFIRKWNWHKDNAAY